MATLFPEWEPGLWIAVAAGLLLVILLAIMLRANRFEVQWRQDGWAAMISLSVLLAGRRITVYRLERSDLLSGSKQARATDRGKGGTTRGGGSDRADVRRRSGTGALKMARQTIKTVEHLELDARIGLGDAMLTSLAAGLCWSVTSLLLAPLQREFSFHSPPQIDFKPLYNELLLQVRATCIFHLRLGDIVWETVKRARADRSAKGGSSVGKPAASH